MVSFKPSLCVLLIFLGWFGLSGNNKERRWMKHWYRRIKKRRRERERREYWITLKYCSNVGITAWVTLRGIFLSQFFFFGGRNWVTVQQHFSFIRRLFYMSPKMPAKVLRRFFIVSSPSSGPPPDPSCACCDELRLKKERAKDPAVAVIGCDPSSVFRRLRNGLPPPSTSRDDCCCSGAECWGVVDPGTGDAEAAGLSLANAGGMAEPLRSISGDSGRLLLVIELRDCALVIVGAGAGARAGPGATPGGRHWVYIISKE